jgi:hypothetical protein
MKTGERQRRQPKLPAVSEQMKAWSGALTAEIGCWPSVTVRPFFGFAAVYRRDRMFAALPGTRSLQNANSLAFKLESPVPRLRKLLQQDPRIESMQPAAPGDNSANRTRWFTFELSEDSDLHGALDWLARSYEAAAKGAKG